MKKTKNFFLKHPFIYSSIIVIVVLLIGFNVFGGNGTDHQTLTIARSTFKRQVSVSGKVVAAQSADLGFEQGGRLGSISAPIGTVVKQGAVIASLENGDVRAELLQKQAALERERAKLASLTQGTRPEQLAIDQQAYDDATRTFVTAMRSAQLDTELTLINDVDTLFENGSSVNPNIVIFVTPYEKERAIENKRLAVTEKMTALKIALAKLSEPFDSAAVQSAGTLAIDALNSTNIFLDDLTTIIDDASLSEDQRNSYRATINEAGQEVSGALDIAQGARTTWNNKRDSLALSKAGSTASDLGAQSASVKAAQADVVSAEARLRKTLIVASFDGTVTRMDVKVGEIIASNSAEISLMSTASYNIESYVPEVHIAYIQPNNPATVTLDAYGDATVFSASVISIDPAETIRDGVSTYKVTLAFGQNDPRIKSGMTGSVTIITLEKPDAIVVPQSVLIKRDGATYVQKMVGGEPVETMVETGSSTSLGQIEIVTGLSEGDTVILNPTK